MPSAAPAPAQRADEPARPPGTLLKPDLKKAGTVQPPARTSTTLARKNLVIGSESSSDDDLGLELIPVGEDDAGGKGEVIPM
jgi:hypothetical protein